MSAASATSREAMANGNAAYEQKFGRVYLVSAAGLSAEQLLVRLLARLGNDPDTERARRPRRVRQDQPPAAAPAAGAGRA